MTQFMTANTFLRLGLEAARGTAAASPLSIPITSPQVTPMQVFLRDEALRGSPTTVYDQVAGVRHDEYDVKGYVFADSFPVLLQGILGNPDIYGGGAGPTYTHTNKLLNNTTGSQPPSLTIQDFDGATEFQMTGAQMSELSLTFGAEAAAEWSAKFMANPYTQISSPVAPSFTTAAFVPGWNISTSIGGTSLAYIAEGEIRLNRNTAPIFTMGTQAPRVNFAGPLEVTGRLLAVVENTSDIFSNASTGYGLFRSAQPTVITLTDPVSSNTIAFTMTKVQYQDVKRQRGKSFVEVEVNFTANANATDAVASSGYSPIAVVTTNNIASAYTGS
jgi:hypothetical protein